jgi:hypothetical protein
VRPRVRSSTWVWPHTSRATTSVPGRCSRRASRSFVPSANVGR